VSKYRKYLEFAALFLLAGLIIWWFGRRLDWDQVKAAIRKSDWRLILAAVVVILIAYLSGILTRRLDAAERLVREQRVERDNLKLLQETLGRTIGTGLVTTDCEGKITSVDNTAAELSRRSPTELAGLDLGSSFPPVGATPIRSDSAPRSIASRTLATMGTAFTQKGSTSTAVRPAWAESTTATTSRVP